ncbi:hypothetical protein FACS1894191_8180 [Clostridia bacterium]|nr:hypothetical protein FACS1894191_8180 [Clostridia bacterium]
MKKFIFFALIVSSIFSLIGCTASSPVPRGSDISIDTDDLDGLNKQYIYPIFISGMTRTSWESPEDIEPDYFIDFFTSLHDLDESVDFDNYPEDELYNILVPADVLESVVQKYFDVAPEHIRKSRFFSSKEEQYRIVGIGGVAESRAISARLDGNILTIDFESFIGEEIGRQGSAALQMEHDGSYKYKSVNRGE